MARLMENVLIVTGECPECHNPLYSWKMKNPDGSKRGTTASCMVCGHRDLKRQEDLDSVKIYNESLKSKGIIFFKNGSIVPNSSLFDKDLSSFISDSEETKNALEKAKAFVNEILLNKNPHFILNGKSGTGKSHLSMGICWEVIKRSNYDKKCLFINYRELLEQLKFSFSDDKARKAIQGNLIADIKTTDLVVLDDVGAELGGGYSKGATPYNNDILHSILEAREDRALIVNTNLTGKEIREAYGERILSRLQNNSKGYVFTFKETEDKRIS